MDPSVISITSSFDPRLALLVGWVTLITKTAVDWLKTAVTMPIWAPPALAFVFAWSLMVLLMLALGVPLTAQLVAQATICALVAVVLAVGQTALQTRTKPSAADPELVQATVAAVKAEMLRDPEGDDPSPSPADTIIGLLDRDETGRAERSGR